MRKRIFAALLILSGCIFISNQAFAAWTQAKGHSYNSFGLSQYKTTEKFTTLHRDSGDNLSTTSGEVYKNQEEEFVSTKVSYYGEYGITDTLTGIASLWWDWQRSNDNMRYAGEDGPSGIGDITLGLRYNLVPDLFGSGVIMSTQAEVKIPEAYHYGYPLEDLSLGDGQYDTTLLLQFGRGLGKGYAVVNVGYKYRFENDQYGSESFKPSDQFKLSLSGGYAVTDKVSINGSLDWFKSVGNAKISDDLYDRATSKYGFNDDTNMTRHELILDTLGLEPDDLQGTVGVEYSITPEVHTAISYSRDLTGDGYFTTKNNAFGETVTLNLIYIH